MRLQREEKGFTTIELMIAMAVFVLVIAAATGIFVPLLNQFKQQNKLSETQIEGSIGLEILRIDIEHAGYGLPWTFENDTINYNEAANVPASNYNDAPDNLPRAIVLGNNLAATLNNSDYLIIKSTIVGESNTAQRWTYIRTEDIPNPKAWGSDDIPNGDRVIVIRPKVGDVRLRELVKDGDTFYTSYSSNAFPLNFSPISPSEVYLIYGVSPNPLRMPFNRADYYIQRPVANMPLRCAPNTGILYKAILDHATGGNIEYPILDCVADIQVVFGLDTNSNNIIGTYTDSNTVVSWPVGSPDENITLAQITATLNDAANLREQLKEVRLYILVHEGQYDRDYTYAGGNTILVGEPALANLGKNFDLTTIDPNSYQNYRWKVYTLVVKPQNLR